MGWRGDSTDAAATGGAGGAGAAANGGSTLYPPLRWCNCAACAVAGAGAHFVHCASAFRVQFIVCWPRSRQINQ